MSEAALNKDALKPADQAARQAFMKVVPGDDRVPEAIGRAAISAYLSALPAPQPDAGDEPVAWRHPEAGWAHKDYTAIAPHCVVGTVPEPLYPPSALSQRDATIEGLRRERDFFEKHYHQKAALIEQNDARWTENENARQDAESALGEAREALEKAAALLEVVAEDAQKSGDTATCAMTSVMAGDIRALDARDPTL